MKRLLPILVIGGLTGLTALGLWLRHPEAEAPPPPAAAMAAAAETAAPTPPATPAPAVASGPAAELAFERLDIETAKDAAEACLVFSHALDASGAARYEDYLAFNPPARPALRLDGQRLCLAGLEFGVSYATELRQGFPAADGVKLPLAKTVQVELRDRPPLLAFRDGLILPRESLAGVPVTTINVERIAIKVLRMPDRLVSQLHPGKLAQRQAYLYQVREIEQDDAALVWRGEMKTAGHRNETVTTLFPLRDAVPERRPGVYMLVAEDAAGRSTLGDDNDAGINDDDNDYRQRAVQWVIDTDIGLTTFQGADGLHVFARSLATAMPLPGLKLSLVARDNDELGKIATDADGHARFDPGLLRGQGGAAATAVMAYGQAGDFTFLDITRPAFDLSDRGVEGRTLPGPVDAFLYTDRGVYRPRETVQVVALLRDRLADALADTPLTLVVKRPDGVIYRRVTLPDQATGAVHYALELTDTAPHGHWKIDAFLDAREPPVGHVEYDVDDFVPQLLKLTLSSAERQLQVNAPVRIDAEARFLYGAPAAELDGEAEARILADPNPFPTYHGYRFGLAQETFKEKVVPLTVETTDVAGKTTASGELNDIPATTLPLKAEIRVAIFEPGGRTTDDDISLPVRTRPLAIGIHPLFKNNRVMEDGEAAFEIIALGDQGQRIARPNLDYQLVREETEYNWYRGSGRWGFERSTHDVPVVKGTLDVGSDAPAVYRRAMSWGYYRLTVLDQASGAATSVRFSAGWRGDLSEDRPDRAEVSADKEKYGIGDTARIAIRPPTAGQALVVIANDRILATRLVTVPADGATIEVPVTAEWGTGAYAVVTHYRALRDGREHVPARSIGLSWLSVDPAPRTLAVTLGAPDRTLPRRTLAVPVDVQGAGGKAFVTLTAVDEGILQLTHFPTPSPNDYYFGKRYLAMDIRDDYARLIDGKGVVGTLRSGGDSIGGRGLEVVPTRTVALFSGLVALDAAGHASIPLDIPDFNGELRLMAVAFDAHKVGMAEGHLTVRDPVVSDVTLPRFLAPGDQSRLSLNLHNLDGEPGLYRARFEASGAVAFPKTQEQEINLAAGQRQLASLPLQGKEPGVGTITLHLTGPDNFAVDRQWQIAVRPPQAPVARETVVALGPGKELRLDPQMLEDFLPGTGGVTVNLSTWRSLPVAGLLQSLDRYPYGCIEQTTSRAFPLLYFNDLALLGGVKVDHALEDRVQGAINRILDMQKTDGRFGMWSAWSYDAADWLSVYALDFLTQAKLKGYQVPDDALDRGRQWLRHLARSNGTGPRTRSYAAYVLAKTNALDLSALRYLFDTAPEQSRDPLPAAQLGAALAIDGDRARARAAFAKIEEQPSLRQPISLRDRYYDDDYYGSTLRDWAGLVAVAAEAGQTGLLTRLFDLYQWVDEDSDTLTTQEKSWLLIAEHALAQRRGTLAIAVNGHAIATTGDPTSLTPDAAALAGGYAVRNLADREIWQAVSVHGVPRTPLAPEAHGITLERAFLTLDGKPAKLSAVRQNDRLIVTLSGTLADSRRHEVALMDLLPAGFEIEGTVPSDKDGDSAYKWLGKQRFMRLKETRDDRFVASFVAHPGQESYDRESGDVSEESGDYLVAYVVRAVTPGTYVLPAATAEDMYRPSVRARTAMGKVTILPREK